MNVNSLNPLQSYQPLNRSQAAPEQAAPAVAGTSQNAAGSSTRQMAETVYISRQAQQMLDTYTQTYAAATESSTSESAETAQAPSSADVVDATRKAQKYQMMQAMAESGALQGNAGNQPQPLPVPASPADTTARPGISLAV
ncbi:hypothetical protein [Chitinilyticum piscinae]|uniref:Uncharacterized protein n=1 Tax=Chitinilyticum piscinae TaxID=2866724 RepID=A0A8J7KCN4_9NEIS|nr:hypothetical protein [Chitinilyticum piscinae]MBE9607929.1 hypothetical protein [Chitinilyticum piscinae]